MPLAPRLHRALDALAMWLEDRVPREPQPYRAGRPGPLDCWGDLGALPPPPAGPGSWSAPAPRGDVTRGDHMVVRWTAARGRSRGTLVLVPPWKTRHAGLLRPWVRVATRAGWDAWLLTPPHHLERTAPGARSGEAFVTADLGRLRGVFEELVLEIRVLMALAARRGPVALLGLSLGGLAAALAATAPEPLDRLALVAPPADMLSVLADTPIGRRYRRLAERAGAPLPGPEALRADLEALSPAARSPSTKRILVATGRHDAIVPPGGPEALASAWGARLRAYPRGHLSLLFACGRLRRDLAGFLAAP